MYSISMDNFYTILEKELNEILPKIKDLRNELHQYPEVAWKEYETRKRLLNMLKDCDKNLHEPYIETDIVFDLGDVREKEALLLRSDMDALSQIESGNATYISKNIGAAHNCGHDGHMSMLTGAALIIDKMIIKGFPLPRPVRFIFQPAEELECGGSQLVPLGILKNVKNVLAIHGWPALAKGELFSREGPFFAAAASFSTVITGKSTHGGLPQNGLSPFPSAAMFINEIEKIHQDLNGKAIISSCRINGGSSDNIIPDSIEVRGTIRYYDPEDFEKIKILFGEAEKKITQKFSCSIKTYYISKYYKPVSNNGDFLKHLSDKLEKASEQFNEIPSQIKETDAKTVSEDFAFYTDERPGALVLLGLGDKTPTLHASNFNFPEEVLKKGILLFITAAYYDI
ncbi:MAG: M20 family metallopeptidase [Spirochaetaceae bacterium]|jgi:amidohydrolase|nr:M20 family metallopeptidase [Spirochaetaceae bacterium]